MVSAKTARDLALAFEETDEKMHFDRIAFRVKGKIFCTLSKEKKEMNFKLTPNDQFIYSKVDPEMIYPVAGGWGRQGWTTIYLPKTNRPFFLEVITRAYCTVAPLKLAQKYSRSPNLQ